MKRVLQCSGCEAVSGLDAIKPIDPAGRLMCEDCGQMVTVVDLGALQAFTSGTGGLDLSVLAGADFDRAVDEAFEASQEASVPEAQGGVALCCTDESPRLARALLSDIIIKYPERHEQALANKRVKQEFRDEVRQAYDEYLRILNREPGAGIDLPFQEAMSEVLASGHALPWGGNR